MNLTRKDGADAALKLLIAARGTLYNIDANDHARKVTEAIESIQGEFWPEQLHPSVYVGEGTAGSERPYPHSWPRPKMGPEFVTDLQIADDEATNEAREADKDDLHPITRGDVNGS